MAKNCWFIPTKELAQMYFSGPVGDSKNNSIYAFGRDVFPNLLRFYHVHFGTQLCFELCAGKSGL